MTEGETVVANGAGSGEGDSNLNSSAASDHDPHFEPIVTLPEVVVPTMEEDEEEMIKLRAKLFRFDSSETPSEWKERGTGDVKLLRHKIKNTVRVVMRRDKTLKICANHFVTPWMELTPNCGSDRAWVWSTEADYTQEAPRQELLAIRFASAEIAQRWKDKFEEAKALVAEHANTSLSSVSSKKSEDSDDESDSDVEKPPCNNDPKQEGKPQSKDAEEVIEKLEKLDVTDKENSVASSPDPTK